MVLEYQVLVSLPCLAQHVLYCLTRFECQRMGGEAIAFAPADQDQLSLVKEILQNEARN